MPLDMFEDILDQIVGKYGTPVINLEGSGEPTMNKRLPLYVEAVTRRGLKSFMYSNGSFLRGQFMQDVVDAGLDFMRFSFIGYNREMYKKWMSMDNFDMVSENAIKLKEYINKSQSDCEVSSYHLILNNNQIEFEVEEYRRNVINKIGTIGYIWKMHNWSGNYKPEYGRETDKRRTCGRPFAPELTVRAGGNNGQTAAVTPCCQTLGPPNEAKSVLGHFSEQTFEEIYFGEKYEELRRLHKEKRFDEIDYCKNCDFLYENPEVLVWSNASEAKTDYMLGTNFSLKDYQ
jgi:MoaA/NifB/PqqE/SkfB family radical SAM enzyme